MYFCQNFKVEVEKVQKWNAPLSRKHRKYIFLGVTPSELFQNCCGWKQFYGRALSIFCYMCLGIFLILFHVLSFLRKSIYEKITI